MAVEETVPHSPLPWMVDDDGDILATTATLSSRSAPHANRVVVRDSLLTIADAEFIVRAVNHHAELVAALKPFAAMVHHDGVDAPYPEEKWIPLLDAAKRAINKVSE